MINKILSFFSRITVRLLTFNVLIVFLPVAALLYLDTYEQQLLRALEHALIQQGRILASALAGQNPLQADSAQKLLQQLEQRHEARLRILNPQGRLLADSSRLGPHRDEVTEAEQNAEDVVPAEQRLLYRIATYPVRLSRRLFRPPEPPLESAGFYINTSILLGPEIQEALEGRYGAMTRISTGGPVAIALSLLASTTIAAPVRKLCRQAREILDHQGRLRGHIRFNRRRDEIGDLSRSLEEMTRKLQGHIEFVESFASDISHEFKNPLASIRSAGEMIARTKSGQDRDRFLALIQKEVARMQHLLGAVREISLLDAQLEEEERASVEVGQILKRVVEAHGLRGGSTVRVTISQNTGPITVSMAPERLVQVLENLLENALSFSPPDGEVRIDLCRDRGQGMIGFEDDGPGIPEQHLEKIFDRFFSFRPAEESSGSASSKPRHLGLGLAIVKAIVEGYSGSVKAENRAVICARLRGSRFEVRLPVVDA
jgi:two-component system sensor histidine kinase ChvG